MRGTRDGDETKEKQETYQQERKKQENGKQEEEGGSASHVPTPQIPAPRAPLRTRKIPKTQKISPNIINHLQGFDDFANIGKTPQQENINEINNKRV